MKKRRDMTKREFAEALRRENMQPATDGYYYLRSDFRVFAGHLKNRREILAFLIREKLRERNTVYHLDMDSMTLSEAR